MNGNRGCLDSIVHVQYFYFEADNIIISRFLKVYVLVHVYRQTFRGVFQLISQMLINHFYYLETFNYGS
jgi:hypothetical protein